MNDSHDLFFFLFLFRKERAEAIQKPYAHALLHRVKGCMRSQRVARARHLPQLVSLALSRLGGDNARTSGIATWNLVDALLRDCGDS